MGEFAGRQGRPTRGSGRASVRMPRYYCDYCDAYLTHDSRSVRKQHCSGFKHKANVRAYYQVFEEQLRCHEIRVQQEAYQRWQRQAVHAQVQSQVQHQMMMQQQQMRMQMNPQQ